MVEEYIILKTEMVYSTWIKIFLIKLIRFPSISTVTISMLLVKDFTQFKELCRHQHFSNKYTIIQAAIVISPKIKLGISVDFSGLMGNLKLKK